MQAKKLVLQNANEFLQQLKIYIDFPRMKKVNGKTELSIFINLFVRFYHQVFKCQILHHFTMPQQLLNRFLNVAVRKNSVT